MLTNFIISKETHNRLCKLGRKVQNHDDLINESMQVNEAVIYLCSDGFSRTNQTGEYIEMCNGNSTFLILESVFVVNKDSISLRVVRYVLVVWNNKEIESPVRLDDEVTA